MNNEALFTSEKDYWETPQNLFNQLNEEFNFTLDPCSTHDNAKCDKHYTVEEDGLQMDWGGSQSSVTHHMVECQQGNGLRNATTNRLNQTLWS